MATARTFSSHFASNAAGLNDGCCNFLLVVLLDDFFFVSHNLLLSLPSTHLHNSQHSLLSALKSSCLLFSSHGHTEQKHNTLELRLFVSRNGKTED